jgi:AcrR family transcriptional regulator
MTGIRAAARKEISAEIKRLARVQIASKGAANLSLREIAREMQMASSAMYRYFDSRDQLLTELIVENYDNIADAVEKADAKCARDDIRNRWMAMAESLRTWALHHPSDYGLIFGTPVPGYAAPPDTVDPGKRYTNVLLRLLADAHAAGYVATIDVPAMKGIAKEYKHVQSNLNLSLPDEMLLAGLAAWAAMFGAISFELFGHVDEVFTNPGIHYSALAHMLGEKLLGISN